jgi:hypothetical protein
MKTCYHCGSDVKPAKAIKEGVTLDCMRCPKCGEEYFTSRALIKFDIKTGRRSMVRKFGTLGDSTVMRFPPNIIRDYKIKNGDFGVFEARPDGILIRVVKADEMK